MTNCMKTAKENFYIVIFLQNYERDINLLIDCCQKYIYLDCNVWDSISAVSESQDSMRFSYISLPSPIPVNALICNLQALTSIASCSWWPQALSPPSWSSTTTIVWQILMRCRTGWALFLDNLEELLNNEKKLRELIVTFARIHSIVRCTWGWI